MTLPTRIALWLPLAVAVAACSPDAATAPDMGALQPGSFNAPTGKKNGFDPSNVMEPKRVIQTATWAAGYLKDYKNQPTTATTYRTCQLNSLEDVDGNDFFSIHAGGYLEEQINEQDGYVLVLEGYVPDGTIRNPPDVYVGRATWNATIWTQWGELWSINSNAQGVIVPVRVGGVAVNAEAETLLTGLRGNYGPGSAGYEFDLERVPLTGTTATDALIEGLLAAASDEARQGVACDWQQAGSWIKQNTITYESTWPKHLNQLY